MYKRQPLRDELELKRMAMARLGKQVVDLEHVSVRFDDKTILDDVDWIIGPGDRYGIVGENGTGKTTLLRVIQGLQRPNAGEVKIGKTVRFAVLSQHLDDLSELGDDRVRQVIGRYSRRTMLDGKEMTPAQLLEKLGFKRADLNEPVKDLSGGHKRRLALMLIPVSYTHLDVYKRQRCWWARSPARLRRSSKRTACCSASRTTTW